MISLSLVPEFRFSSRSRRLYIRPFNIIIVLVLILLQVLSNIQGFSILGDTGVKLWVPDCITGIDSLKSVNDMISNSYLQTEKQKIFGF